MALVCPDNKIVFIHIFRAAGNSIRKMLSYFPSQEVLTVHCDAADLKAEMISSGKSNLWQESFKFSFIRNPFDWMVSTYMYHRQNNNNDYFQGITTMSFEEFVLWYTEVAMKERRQAGTNKCITLGEFIYDAYGNPLVDFIGRYENMVQDWQEVCLKIGIYNRVNVLPKINEGSARAGRHYRSFYTDRSINMVTQAFAKDLQMFNYKF